MMAAKFTEAIVFDGYYRAGLTARKINASSLLRAWLRNHMARRGLLHCLSADPRFAKDIGFVPADIVTECRAPFWRLVPRVGVVLRR